MAKNWHVYDVISLAKQLNTSLSDGLSPREAAMRLEKRRKKTKGKKWSLFVSDSRGAFKTFIDLVANPFAIALIALSALAAVFGRGALGLSIFTVAVTAIVIGGLISRAATKNLEDMKDYASPMVRVRRGGNTYHIDGRNLVCGDVIIVGKGDLLPCDARIIRCDGLRVDEFYRDGEKTLRRNLRKSADVSYSEDSDIVAPDSENMLYAGSAVCEGWALCLVVEVGGDVYLGEYMKCGALGDKESEPICVKNLFFEIRRASFVLVAFLELLSILALVTLGKKADLFFIFTTLLAAFFYISVNLPAFGSKAIFSSYISRARHSKTSKKKRSNHAYVRNVKSLDILSGVTDLVLIGKAGITLGELKLGSVYIPEHGLTSFDDKERCQQLLSLLYTYVKAKNEKNDEYGDRADVICDSVRGHLRSCGFDLSGADMLLQSLSYSYDVKLGYCFAYAETSTRFFRVGLIYDRKSVEICDHVRDGDEQREITAQDIAKIADAYKRFDDESLVTAALISESDGKTVLEAILSFSRGIDCEFIAATQKFAEFGVKTTILLDNEDKETQVLLNDEAIAAFVGDRIAFASDFKAASLDILHNIGEYRAYVGFEQTDYLRLLREMKKNGSVIAAFGVSDDRNEVMAAATVGVSCDVVTYSGNKFRESIYEYLPAEGEDSCVRASQRTRLLAKVIVPRAGERGGGISSVFKALRLARAAHISFAHSMLLFAILMTSLLTFVFMSVLTGNLLLDPLQTIALSSAIAILSFTVFSDTEPSGKMLAQSRDYRAYSMSLLKESLPDMIGSIATAASVSVAVMILNLCGIFGTAPSFTLPIYLCMIFTVVVRSFSVRSRLVRLRDGRGRVNTKLIFAIVFLVLVGAIEFLKPFATEFYKQGIGLYELFIIPVYAALYMLSLLISRFIAAKKARK